MSVAGLGRCVAVAARVNQSAKDAKVTLGFDARHPIVDLGKESLLLDSVAD
jgi:hypothetical protein